MESQPQTGRVGILIALHRGKVVVWAGWETPVCTEWPGPVSHVQDTALAQVLEEDEVRCQ